MQDAHYFKDHQISNYNFPKLRKLYIKDDLDDSQNAIFNREDQSTLTNDKTDFAYNFHIELSPYYFIAQRCISKGKYFIENDNFEFYFTGYQRTLVGNNCKTLCPVNDSEQ